MARIIYGVCGEGSGHAVRSREVLRSLRARNHELHVVTFGRAYDFLKDEFPCTEIAGIRFAYERNAIRYLATLWKNVYTTPTFIEGARERLPKPVREALPIELGTRNIENILKVCQTFQPDTFISDFEAFTAMAAARLERPLISVDNIHRLVFQVEHVPLRYRHHWVALKGIIALFAPKANHYFVTTLRPEYARGEEVSYVPAIVRPEILSAAPIEGNHVLVYNSFADERLPTLLSQTSEQYIVYGYNREGCQGNMDFRLFDEKRFLEDLRTCKALMGTGGFTLLSESLILKKPYLVLPLKNQFEQVENALEIERLGYGSMSSQPTAQGINDFLRQLPKYCQRLESYHHPGNEQTFAWIDEEIAKRQGAHS